MATMKEYIEGVKRPMDVDKIKQLKLHAKLNAAAEDGVARADEESKEYENFDGPDTDSKRAEKESSIDYAKQLYK